MSELIAMTHKKASKPVFVPMSQVADLKHKGWTVVPAVKQSKTQTGAK